MQKKLLVLFFLVFAITAKSQNCCDVIDGPSVSVITQNGLCVVTQRAYGISCIEDLDGDGIADANDKCPEVAGTTAFDGCPPTDTDKDGVYDSEDNCPTVYGKIKGCPDTDNDGIIDNEDDCPKVAGKIKGCPDSDGDGIIDKTDVCPNTAGTAAMSGCPDSDGDGVADNNDKCPNEAGIAKNKGCPEVDEETTSVLLEALKGVQFESGKDIIKVSSFGILNKVVDVMQRHSEFGLKISGHTDSQGRDDANLDLSKRRAAAVKKFIADHGIKEDRMESDGYGETVPVADNATASGRAKNRRVEFEIMY